MLKAMTFFGLWAPRKTMSSETETKLGQAEIFFIWNAFLNITDVRC